MLGARRIALRTACQPWTAERRLPLRSLRHVSGEPPAHSTASTSTSTARHKGNDHGTRKPAWSGKTYDVRHRARDAREKQSAGAPSLMEQLFPEETKRYEAERKAAREVPRLPLGSPPRTELASSARFATKKHKQPHSRAKQLLLHEIEATEPGPAVLVLRNASKNLTEEDFRRLIPQGQHIEGWTLTEGDILQVIPSRSLTDLDQGNVYYILFSSALSAFSYQGHVTRIHRVAAAHAPHSSAATIAPPPGWMLEGIDVHAAIQAYALVPPSQKLELRQLRPPLAPVMDYLVRNGGYDGIINRPGKMPFEARLTMGGPQLQPSMVRHIIMESGKQRGMSWSGGENFDLDVTRWETKTTTTNPGNRSARTERRMANKHQEDESEETNGLAALQAATEENGKADQKRRTPQVVLIIGFHTERAAQSFVAHWHRQPLQPAKAGFEEDDLPPIANVQMLW